MAAFHFAPLAGFECPLTFKGGDANLYRYVRNNVTRSIDPKGLEGDEERIVIRGVGAGALAWEATLRGRTAIQLGGEPFYVTGRPQPGMWKPKSGSTSSLLIYKKADPNRVFRLDYHPLKSTRGRPAWHYNRTSGFAKIKGLRPADHTPTSGAKALGRTLTIFRHGGRAVLVGGIAASAYEVYHAENVPREIARQVGGWSGALAGSKLGASAGVKTGAGFMGIVGQLGPQAAAPEELVTVPTGAAVGGILGAIGGGIGGWLLGTEVTETVFDWFFTPVETEEWVICREP